MSYTRTPKLLNCTSTSMPSNPAQLFTGLVFPSSSIMHLSTIGCGYHVYHITGVSFYKHPKIYRPRPSVARHTIFLAIATPIPQENFLGMALVMS